MNWHVVSTIPLGDLVALGEVTQIVGSVENIGSQDVAGLLGIPDLGFSDLVGDIGDFNESGGSPDDVVTSQVP